MSKGLLILLLLVYCDTVLSSQIREVSQKQATAQIADEFVSARNFSGVVLVARDGRVLFEKAYGLANRELAVPNKLETKFRLGSVTKQFTAMAVMILTERGKIRLTDSVCRYIENCPS